MKNSVFENVIEPVIIANKLAGDKPEDTTMNDAFEKLIEELKKGKG